MSDHIELIVFNVYMPCDKRCYGVELDEYNDILNEISGYLHKNEPMFCIIDFNTDFTRDTPQTEALSSYNVEKFMNNSLKDNCSIDFTYSTEDGTVMSVIDHIFTSSNMNDFFGRLCFC